MKDQDLMQMFQESSQLLAAAEKDFNRMQGEKDSLVKQLEEVSRQCEASYGTSDLNKLREIHKQKSEEKKRQVLKFKQDVETFAGMVNAVKASQDGSAA